MNHIKRLQQELAAAQNQIKAFEQGIQDVEGYLCSSKFEEDTTVQASDVLRRIQEVKYSVTDAGA